MVTIKTNTKKIRTYRELIRYPTFIDRFRYLSLSGIVGETTFGYDRYINQYLYKSRQWKKLRDEIIMRDDGGDLGVPDYPIVGKIIVHHMNPLLVQDVEELDESIFDPDLLICVSHNTHNAIHFGDESLLVTGLVVRRPGDTCPWK